MRVLVLGGLATYLAVFVSNCSRVEEPNPPRSVHAAPASPQPGNPATTSAASAPREPASGTAPANPATAAGRCMVPMPEEAPSPAQPAAACPVEDDAPPHFGQGAVRFPEAPGTPKLKVELARAPELRSHGLMYRKSMPQDRGMLFSWPAAQQQTFWMHNTCIPLDMLFIAEDGTIVGVLEQVPTLNDRGRTVPCPVLHVLEVNAGWTRKHGVRPGQKIALEIPD